MSRFVQAAGVRVHYVEHGPPTAKLAPTIVLLHGFPLDHRMMLGCFEPVFARRPSWRRLYLDLPGHGATAAPEWVASTDDVFDVARAAVERLVPGPFAVAGESYGACLARGLVAAMPGRVDGLALVAPMIVAALARRDVPPRQVLLREDGLPADADFEEFAVIQTEATYERTLLEVVTGLVAADPGAVARIEARYAPTFPLDAEPFDRPTLILCGRQDSVTGYRDAWPLLERYPRATFAVLDRAGHNLQIEQPALFEALVGEWLDRVDEARQRRR